MSIRTFSFGGGVQSTAALVLASQGRIDYRTFLFANVGEDSENPKTLEYLENVAKPYAAANGLELIELQRIKRTGEVETLYGRAMSTQKSIPLPARASSGAPMRRTCTTDFKIRVIVKWLKKAGATAENPAITGLGISLDEFHRARTDSGIDCQLLQYPLIDLRLTRSDCIKIIAGAGLPVPPKSSCYFCPFHSPTEWQRLKCEQPELFERAVVLENRLNEKSGDLLKCHRVYLHPSLSPLSDAVADQKPLWEEMAVCESGYCFT